MTTPGGPKQRAQLVRRTRLVRRGVIAAGTTAALGAAVAIGTTIQTSGSAAPGVRDDETATDGDGSLEVPEDQGLDQTQQPPQAGQLAGPSGGGPAQGHTAGS